MRTSYVEQLRDPRWQKCRLKIMERDHWTCQMCGDHTSTLNVHHRDYIPDTPPWDYPAHWLVTLCETCHQWETTARQHAESELIKTFRRLGLFTHQMIALAAALEAWDITENAQGRLPAVDGSPLVAALTVPEFMRYFELVQLDRRLDAKNSTTSPHHVRVREQLAGIKHTAEHYWEFWVRILPPEPPAPEPTPEPEPVVVDEQVQQQAKQLWRRFSMLQTLGNQQRYRRRR